ncbi:hypothetical protein FCM35_KLT05981 [Carex littledalei]|uniref:Zinc finger PHD-type domain-containing protein n=1 Tax=Carex littledalei TaxID=544730 RepID=A0A833VMY1_9POAL|nr:hypothetical protein FCM35_KLT05981 [Carex littledalei]
MLTYASFDENSSEAVKESVKIGSLSSVKRLLETGFFEGMPITCFSEELGVLPAKVFEKHAGADTIFQTDHIFFSNEINIYEVLQLVRNIPESDFYVKILKLRIHLKDQKIYEEPPRVPAVLHPLPNTFGASRQFLKYYRRYNPARPLIDVRGLLLTGLLEGFRVTYKRNEARLEARIRGSAYECGCSSCNYTKVVTAKELETHAREFSKNQQENIYLDSGITLYKLVKELKGIPLYLLGNLLQEKIKCSPNYSSFEIWKGSFKMGGGFPNLRSNFDNQLEVNSKCCSVQSVLMHRVQKHVQRAMFEFSGSESTTASDFTDSAIEDPDYSPLESTSKTGLTGEEKNLSRRVLTRRGRDASLHKRIFESLPNGTVLTYCYHDKILLTGYKQGSAIKCTCHNYELTPSDFEAHAGMTQKRRLDESIYNSDGKTLPELSLELPDIPRSSSVVLSPRRGKRDQNKHHKQITKSLQNNTQGFAVSTRLRLKRVLQSLKGVLVCCTICKERYASLGDEADPKLIIFCNQCDRAYHVGCLENQEPFEIEDVLNGTWFCSADCTRVHDCLTNICALGAKPVPAPFLDLLKRPLAAESNRLKLCWQVFGGGNTEDQMLLSQSLKFIKGAFKPIIHGKEDIIREMVYGEKIISIAVLRVFGKFVAELPLVTSSKLWRQKVQMLKEQHGLILFEDTAVLVKEIRASSD